MQIISFAWTTAALLNGHKTVTRRDWNDAYGKKFQNGDLVQAYNKSPRNFGERVGIIKIEDIWLEPLSRLINEENYGIEEMKKEGVICAPLVFVKSFSNRRKDGNVWRIEFKIERIERGAQFMK